MEESIGTLTLSDSQDSGVSAADIAADWNSAEGSGLPAETSAMRAPAADTSANQSAGAEWPDDTAAADDKTSAGATVRRETNQSFALKHLGEVKTVGRDEIVTLAQKGLDYDRQRQKNDELLSRNNALAAETERLRARRLGGPEPGVHVMGREEAMAQRRDREIGEFIAEYRSLDPKDIPKEVWQAVTAGKPLLAAYQAWELKKLRAESSAASKAAENRVKAAGSRTSAGSERHMDAITADWYSS
jgi:hypothetical protein